MKKNLWIALLLTSAAIAGENAGNLRVGADFGMPYYLTVDNTKVNDRGNYNVGLDARYFTTESFNVGGRFSYDLEDNNGFRQMSFAPGVQYHWMPQERFVPYVRADVPVIFQGAANTGAADDKMDVGVSAGAGVAWNLGQSMGINQLSLRYDFNMGYTFGIKTALPVLNLELAKVGLDYRF